MNKPSEKQVRTAQFISKTLSIKMPANTKEDMWKFIHDNLEHANQKRQAQNIGVAEYVEEFLDNSLFF